MNGQNLMISLYALVFFGGSEYRFRSRKIRNYVQKGFWILNQISCHSMIACHIELIFWSDILNLKCICVLRKWTQWLFMGLRFKSRQTELSHRWLFKSVSKKYEIVTLVRFRCHWTCYASEGSSELQWCCMLESNKKTLVAISSFLALPGEQSHANSRLCELWA
jgi:hypothetical protein